MIGQNNYFGENEVEETKSKGSGSRLAGRQQSEMMGSTGLIFKVMFSCGLSVRPTRPVQI